jgi:hypothetical protein
MKHFPASEELEPTTEELAFVEESRRLGGVASTPYVPQVDDTLTYDDWDAARQHFRDLPRHLEWHGACGRQGGCQSIGCREGPPGTATAGCLALWANCPRAMLLDRLPARPGRRPCAICCYFSFPGTANERDLRCFYEGVRRPSCNGHDSTDDFFDNLAAHFGQPLFASQIHVIAEVHRFLDGLQTNAVRGAVNRSSPETAACHPH